MSLSGSVSLDGETHGIIRIPLHELQALRVALAPCGCRANKSLATERTRESLRGALGKLQQEARLAGIVIKEPNGNG